MVATTALRLAPPAPPAALAPPAPGASASRPRVEGDRELEILAAALEVLSDVGYDRLTMDAVAARAHASKATLYRRWNGKVSLVIDAVLSVKAAPDLPDTGTLRGDLLQAFCGTGGLMEQKSVASFASVLTAISRDREFADAFRERVTGPKIALTRAIFTRARDRGEIPAHVDVDLLAPALAGIVLHRMFILDETPGPELVARVIDQIILPAATCPGAATSHPKETHS